MIAAPMIAASFWAPPVTPSPFSTKSDHHPPHAPRATLSQSCAAPSGLCTAAPLKLPARTSTRNARAREESGVVEHPRDECRREEQRKVGELGRGDRGREERGRVERTGKKRGGNGVASGDGETNARSRREQRRARERALLTALMAARLGGQATARERAAAAARMVTPALMRAVRQNQFAGEAAAWASSEGEAADWAGMRVVVQGVCVGAGDMARAEHLVRLAQAAGGAAAPNCRVLTVMARGYCQAGQRRQAYALLQVSQAYALLQVSQAYALLQVSQAYALLQVSQAYALLQVSQAYALLQVSQAYALLQVSQAYALLQVSQAYALLQVSQAYALLQVSHGRHCC
ncbi:unnamed protein product, partial [Closterium sp. NIES-65]